MARTPVSIPNVIALSFENGIPAQDGESMIFTMKDTSGNVAHISFSWEHLGLALQVIERAAEKCGEVRAGMGKSNLFDPQRTRTFQLVQTFQVSEVEQPPLKILSLQNPVGLRCDFAIPTNTQDQLKRSLPRAIAEELTKDHLAERKQPM